jgi:hypothetical protein
VSWREWARSRIKESWEHHGIQAGLVFCGIGGANIGIFWTLYYRLRGKTEEWYGARTPDFDPDQVQTWCVQTHEGQEALCARLSEQVQIAQMRSAFHFDLFGHYSSEHFAAISVAFWASIFTAACLAYLVKKGWENAHNVMAAAFIAFSISVAFYGGYPALAKHEDNITDNEFLYLEHQNLVQEIRTFAVTGDLRHEDHIEMTPETENEEEKTLLKEMTFAHYIGHIDERLRVLNRIPLEFDASQIDLGSTKFLETQAEVK